MWADRWPFGAAWAALCGGDGAAAQGYSSVGNTGRVTTFRFDSDTAGHDGAGRSVDIDLHPEWNVDGRILNGGYLQAAAVRCVMERIPGPARPIAVSTSFAAAATPGPASVSVDLLRSGSRIASASVTLRQGGEVVLASLVTVALGEGRDGDVPSTASSTASRAGSSGGSPGMPTGRPMPSVRGPGDSIRVPAHALPGPPGLAGLIDYAFVPENSRWLGGDYSGGPHIRCWLAFLDGRPVDVLAAIAMTDFAPPVCFAQGRFGWAPTLQLQVGIFADPTPGPMLLDLRGEPYDGAVVAEDGLLWDSAGTLIARSRQIALAPRV